jgi:uroporphyrinogen-III synthase
MYTDTLLITRPEPHAAQTAAHYTAQGWRCILSPAIITTAHQDAKSRIATLAPHCDAWIVTSAVALELLAEYYNTISSDHSTSSPHPFASSKGRGVLPPLYVTGKVLADRALAAGFTRVQHGGGSAEGLYNWLCTHGDSALRYGYLHSNYQTLPFVTQLRAIGWQAEGAEIYHSHPAPHLTEEARLALQRGEIDAVSFYSTMTLHSFLALTTQANVQHCLAGMEAWCYSDAIARAVPSGLFAQVKRIDIASAL